MTTIAVMQPYFLPYAGYFRLFQEADIVCFFDCVQFPRRGWVHRNRLPGVAGISRWLTLPLAKGPMEIQISNLAFAEDARVSMASRCHAFPVLRNVQHRLYEAALRTEGDVVDYLIRLLSMACDEMGLPFNVMRTTSLQIPTAFSGQDRVFEVCRRLSAKRYVNLSGGHRLYDREAFAHRGIEFDLFDEWRGSDWSILYRLLTEPAYRIAEEIRNPH